MDTKKHKAEVVARAIKMVEEATIVGLDLETTDLDPRQGELRLLQVDDGEQTFVLDLRNVDVRPVVETLAATTIVAHNAIFEWQWIYHHFGIELLDIRDTMLMARLLTCGDFSISVALEAVVERYLDEEMDKEMQTSDWSAENLTQRQRDYAAFDAIVLLPLYEFLDEELREADLHRIAEIENATVPAVARMVYEGMPVDKKAWDRCAEAVASELKRLEREMLEAEWMPERDPIPQTWALQGEDCERMLESTLGFPVPGTTAKDLKDVVRSHVLVEKLLAYRKAKGEERENLRASVLEHAVEKPPAPAPPWNFGSPDQVHEIIHKIMGWDVDSTDEATLLRFAHAHPFFKELLEHRSLKKRASTYGPAWFKGAYDAGRVRPSWRQIGTSTGRFACRNPNAQNIPLSYRRFFVAPEGRTFVDVDYSQIEVRLIAKYLDIKELLRLFEEGADIYRHTIAGMLGVAPEEITREQRSLAKAIVLGMLYGLSAFGLPTYAYKNYNIELTPEEAENYVSAFYGVYPEIENYHQSVLANLNEYGIVDQTTMTGRLRAGITVRNEAINAPIQGTAADGLKAAMALVDERLRERFGGTAFIVATIHDELLVESDEADGSDVLEIVSKAMVEAMDAIVNETGPRVPITVEGRVTKTWTKD